MLYAELDFPEGFKRVNQPDIASGFYDCYANPLEHDCVLWWGSDRRTVFVIYPEYRVSRTIDDDPNSLTWGLVVGGKLLFKSEFFELDGAPEIEDEDA